MNSKEVNHREYYYLSNIRYNARLQGIKNIHTIPKIILCEMVNIPFKTLKELKNIPSIVQQKEKNEIYNHPYYQTENIRKLAVSKGISNPKIYIKKELCEMIGEKYKSESKRFPYSLTNIKTNEIKKFKSASAISKSLIIGLTVVYNKARNGQTLVVDGVSYTVKKID